MNPPKSNHTAPSISARPAPEDDPPGVPGFESWRKVYWAVVLILAATVAALAALPLLGK